MNHPSSVLSNLLLQAANAWSDIVRTHLATVSPRESCLQLSINFRTSMAIHPKPHGPVDPSASQVAQPSIARISSGARAEIVDISSLSAPSGVRGTSVSLAIPLDEGAAVKSNTGTELEKELHRSVNASSVHRPRHEPIRRDSLKRREALLKGKEGSRRRQRWENGSYQQNPRPSLVLTASPASYRPPLEQSLGATPSPF